jgi:hypothetical protein
VWQSVFSDQRIDGKEKHEEVIRTDVVDVTSAGVD